MAVKRESSRNYEGLVSEANGARSRDDVVIAPGTAPRPNTLAAKRDSDNTYINWNPTGTPPGGGTIKGLFTETVDNTGTGTPPTRTTVIARDAEWNTDQVDWNGATAAQQATATTQLANLGIILREGM